MEGDSGEPGDHLHSNWVALATVKFKPKIFIKSSGTENDRNFTELSTAKIEIDGSAKEAYEEILQTPSTSSDVVLKKQKKNPVKKMRRKPKIPFVKENLFKFSMQDNSNEIRNLIENSLNPEINATDAFGWTALMMAACENATEAVQTLLDLGADASISDKTGATAESLARKKNFQEILQILEDSQVESEDDEILEENEEDDGTIFCPECHIEVSKSGSTSHQTSTAHLFSCKFKGNTDIKSFGISKSNLGYQMMKKSLGWDGKSGLGAKQDGKLYPVKTVLRKNRTGLGIKQDSAKITHFKPYDLRAVRYRSPPRVLTRKEILENDLREKRQTQRLRQELS